jgi:hypothetical protein
VTTTISITVPETQIARSSPASSSSTISSTIAITPQAPTARRLIVIAAIRIAAQNSATVNTATAPGSGDSSIEARWITYRNGTSTSATLIWVRISKAGTWNTTVHSAAAAAAYSATSGICAPHCGASFADVVTRAATSQASVPTRRIALRRRAESRRCATKTRRNASSRPARPLPSTPRSYQGPGGGRVTRRSVRPVAVALPVRDPIRTAIVVLVSVRGGVATVEQPALPIDRAAHAQLVQHDHRPERVLGDRARHSP